MTLADISNGPGWIPWAVSGLFAVLSILLLSGRGSGLIAGYNTASKKEKEKYNKKKLCHTAGSGLAVISVLIFVTTLFEKVLPDDFVYILLGVIIIDCLSMIIAGNTICRK